MKRALIKACERGLAFIAIIVFVFTMTGCAAFEVETKNVIDYRYTPAHEYDISSGDNVLREYEPECYELLFEYTYANGSQERKWETCTRFEYQNTREELGGIDE